MEKKICLQWIKRHAEIKSKWIEKDILSGILSSRKKEGTPTLHDSMDGTGEHYAKWKKPGGERQIPYDLTYK